MSSNPEVLLEACDLTVIRGDKIILEAVSLQLRGGEFTGLIGPNGAGKSTLLEALLGITPSQSGQIHLRSSPLSSLTRRQIAQQVSWIPQQPFSGFNYTVREVIELGRLPFQSRLQPFSEQDRDAVNRAIETLGLTSFVDRRMLDLSGGEIQRVLLARAMAQNCPVMLLDEPASNLDLFRQHELLDFLRTQAASGKGIIAAVHDLDLAVKYCDRVIVLHQGQIDSTGTPAALIDGPLLARVFQVRGQVMAGEDDSRIRILIDGVAP